MRNATTLAAGVLLWVLLILSACVDSPVEPGLPDTESTGVEEPAALLTWGLPRLDQQQPKVYTRRAPLAVYPAGVGQNLAQTYTAGRTGWLYWINMPVSCSASALLHLQVRDVWGTTASSQYIDVAHTVADGTMVALRLSRPLRQVAGTRYVIMLSTVANRAAPAGPVTCSVVPGPTGNSYGGGQGWYLDPASPAGWVPLPDGSPGSDEDLPFQTYVS